METVVNNIVFKLILNPVNQNVQAEWDMFTHMQLHTIYVHIYKLHIKCF